MVAVLSRGVMSDFLVRFDPEADAIYVYFLDSENPDVYCTGELGDGRQVD